MDDSGHARVKEYYENGHFKSRTNYVTRMVTLADGMIETLDKPKPLDIVPAKTVTVVQHAAEFPGGGIMEWTSYLSRNLHTPRPLIDIAGPNTKDTVVVEFLLNKTGQIGIFLSGDLRNGLPILTLCVLFNPAPTGSLLNKTEKLSYTDTGKALPTRSEINLPILLIPIK